MPLLHTGVTDVAISNPSGALQLGSNGTTYSLPTSGNGTDTRLELDQSSTALSWKKKHLADIRKNSSQTLPPNVDVTWSIQTLDIGDISFSSGAITLPVDNYFLITVNIRFSSISGNNMELALVDGSNNQLSQRFKPFSTVASTSASGQSTVTFVHTTYGASGAGLILKLRNVGGVTGSVEVGCISIVSL